LEGSDSTEASEDALPPALQQTLSGVPREIRNFQSFFNPNPQTEWNNLQGDSDTDTALIATMYDGNPEPKTYHQALASHDFQNWWAAMCVEFKNMKDKQVWEITPKGSFPPGCKIIGSLWVFARKDERY
jgi:hypothetical protein